VNIEVKKQKTKNAIAKNSNGESAKEGVAAVGFPSLIPLF